MLNLLALLDRYSAPEHKIAESVAKYCRLLDGKMCPLDVQEEILEEISVLSS